MCAGGRDQEGLRRGASGLCHDMLNCAVGIHNQFCHIRQPQWYIKQLYKGMAL